MIKILKSTLVQNSYGTNRKLMEWEGEWGTKEELAKVLVNEMNAPYGWHIEIKQRDDENKRYKGVVSEYWD